MFDYFSIKDIIDILLVATFMNQAYLIMRRSGTSILFNGVLAFLILWLLVSKIFKMQLLGIILDSIVNAGLITLVILFQDDIKRFLMSLSSSRLILKLQKIFGKNKGAVETTAYTTIVQACVNLSKTRTGALIVIQENVELSIYEQTGETINADINQLLIENIFFKNSPLHDGAMIIAHGKIKSAGCILPISRSQEIPKHFGLRHRAGLGVTVETDAKVIIVSEERGKISFAQNGEIQANVSPEKLQELLLENNPR